MNKPKQKINNLDNNYPLGFSMPEVGTYKTAKGINTEVIKQISKRKNEPAWMLEKRLQAFEVFKDKEMPRWGADLSSINFDNFHYYIKPEGTSTKTWDDVPDDIKNTFDKIGIPQAEREYLAGVKSQYDSEVMYGSIKPALEKQGVIFLSFDEALKQYPEIVKQYFGTIIPATDNKFSALNTAVWSGGSFVYIPENVKVTLPLQAYFRINSSDAGQFERTLIIAEKNSSVHYTEGCFTKGGASINTKKGYKEIENITTDDYVLTHKGRYKKVTHTQKRKYTGDIFDIKIWGESSLTMKVTSEHPILTVKRQNKNERNYKWETIWKNPCELKPLDYLVVPINKTIKTLETRNFEVTFKNEIIIMSIKNIPDFYRLIGYYLAEGSINEKGYLRFSFNISEQVFVNDIKQIIKNLFGLEKSYESRYKDRNGMELTFASAKLARLFKQFGTKSHLKSLPSWAITESLKNQKELVKAYFRGDGNYFDIDYSNNVNLIKPGRKELFRINSVSEILIRQMRDILLRLEIVSFINLRNREKEGRKSMYTLGISGEYMIKFGQIVGIKIDQEMNEKKRATRFFIDEKNAYFPIRTVNKYKIKSVYVYNFGVKDDETYIANSVAVHNCSAPAYSSGSLHSAVVEIIVKENAKVQYTTIQNWYKNVYNLVTKRAIAHKNAHMSWVDCNLGSKITMKYPSVYLVGEHAHGEILSIAFAGNGQHQDAGGKIIHNAPNTTSRITAKSICKNGGRSSYRGLLHVAKNATNVKSKVICDALILDNKSQTDTYPTMDIKNNRVKIEHEATVSKVSEKQLFYLTSRGLSEEEASSLIVNGFIEPIVKELPMEYAVELNRLIKLEMTGSVG